MQEFGQWLPQSQDTVDLYFSSVVMPSQINSSIEQQDRTYADISLEKESISSLHFGNVSGPIEGNGHCAGPIEGIGNGAGPIEGIGNGSGPTEGIDLNKTPVPKPKRKKHRPKVLKEGKPTKTPNSATPKYPNVKGEKPSGKRKYVRRKGLNTLPSQPPSEDADSQCRAEPKPVRRCLNFDGEDLQENAHCRAEPKPGSQVQVAEVYIGPRDSQSSISTGQRNARVEVECNLGATTNSIYSSADLMANAQLLPTDSMQKGVTLDLNSSMNQIQSEFVNFMDRPTQFFRSGRRETLDTNPLLELFAGMPDKSVPDLNSSINQMQNMSTNIAEYLFSLSQDSTREMQRADQMLHDYGMLENPIPPTQCIERVTMGGNLNPKPSTREAVMIDQMLHGYRVAQSPLPPPKCIERDSMKENLNQLATKNDYLKFATNLYRHTGAALGPYDSRDSVHLQSIDSRREHNAANSACFSLDVNSDHPNSAGAFVNVSHATTSRATYFPETYKRMRTGNYNDCLNGVGGNFCSTSAYLSSNWNTNKVSAINSNVFTLADAQRLIALEKSRASQGMHDFGFSENNMVIRSNLVQQHDTPMTCGITNKDCISSTDKQIRQTTAECARLPNSQISLPRENYIPRNGSPALQSLEQNMVKGSDLLAKLHSTSPQDNNINRNCIANPDGHIRSISGELVRCPMIPITPINPSIGSDILRTENCHVEVSRETIAVKTSDKPKARGRPRKEAKPGEKPKRRGRPRKEDIIAAEHKSKGNHNDLLKNEDVSCISGPCAGETPGEGICRGIAPWVDRLDLIIQRIKFLDINKSDEIEAAEPRGAIVPYKGEYGAIVPYEGKVRKKRSRARVNLDPVTALMWKLLMGPDMSDGAEGMDKDKEKWLDEERKIFQGRVDSFIARMHLVQGDRRFSPWKGSVVDSVVGVFLTQNVSDHLSSSAFMALAAKFPVKSEGAEKPAAEVFHTSAEQKVGFSGPFGDANKLQDKLLVEEISNTGSLVTTEEKEGSNSDELFGSFSGDGVDCAVRLHESGPHGAILTAVGTGSAVEAEDGSLEDVVSSQNSVVSSQSSPDYLFHTTDHIGSSSLANLTAEDFIGKRVSNGMGGSTTTYTELLRMQELQSKSNEKSGPLECHSIPVSHSEKGALLNEMNNISSKHQPVHSYISFLQNGQADFPGSPYVNNFDKSFYTGLDRVNDSNVRQANTGLYHLSSTSGVTSNNRTKMTDCLSGLLHGIDGSLSQEKSSFPPEPLEEADLISPIIGKYFQPLTSSETVSYDREYSFCGHNLSRNETQSTFVKQHESSNLQEGCTTRTKQMRGVHFQPGCNQQGGDVRIQATEPGNHCSSSLGQNQKSNSEVLQAIASDIEKCKDAQKSLPQVPGAQSKAKKARSGTAKRTYDWDNLRKEVLCKFGDKERGRNANDSIDWEALRQADVRAISDTIRERGMNNMLAERIKDFLNRLVRDHGSIDLEWLRDVQPDKAKDYLLSIRGLGLKSVECVRLLTLHHMAFPVDTNVGRICVRLGWVPLQPLPESLQLHLLELYPMLENIQKYLWPRLCKLDQRTLYELHYQMITFGKVFCTKSKPNCNACPMRAECKHFASAFASARLALPGPEEKSLVTSGTPIAAESCQQTYISSRTVDQLVWNANSHEHVLENGQPIIEEPASPEPEPAEIREGAIEDIFIEDPDEIPTIKLNFEEFTQNLKSYMQANNIEIEDADMSKALVAITPEAASLPTPKLKNVSRLRTEHQVYELPDTHPLLEGFDQREPDDPCPYLLSIWTPGETAQSTDAPKTFCNSQETRKLCESATCFSCNSIREVQAQKVRGTLLIPCRTAMRGSFPLNGTYFQVNEVFADHDTSQNPIDVPRNWIWNLPRRTVYFGTSIPTIFKGLSTEDIQHCFWRGFVCVRGFDRTSRAPRPLYARLHFPASKITRNKKSAASAAAREDE